MMRPQDLRGDQKWACMALVPSSVIPTAVTSQVYRESTSDDYFLYLIFQNKSAPPYATHPSAIPGKIK